MTDFSVKDLALLYSIQFDGIVSLKKDKVFKLFANGHFYVLKEMDYDENNFIICAMEYLCDKGVLINSPIKSNTGQYINEIGGKFMLLTKFLPGNPLDYSSKESVALAGRSLATLHEKSKGFIYNGASSRIKWGSVMSTMINKRRELFSYSEHIMALDSKNQIDYLFLDNYMDMADEIDLAIFLLEKGHYYDIDKAESLVGGICHHDLAYHNMLIYEDSCAFIDFDYCLCDISCHDIANFLSKLLKYNNYNLDMVKYALESYDSVSSLSNDRLNIIKGIMVFPQEFWQIAFSYLVEKRHSYNRLEKKMLYSISDMKYRKKAMGSLIKLSLEGYL